MIRWTPGEFDPLKALLVFAGILWVVALSEEFFFRGLVQQWVRDSTGSPRCQLPTDENQQRRDRCNSNQKLLRLLAPEPRNENKTCAKGTDNRTNGVRSVNATDEFRWILTV